METQEIFDRLLAMRQRIEQDSEQAMTEADNSLLWDVARTLGLTDEQAGILAGDPPLAEIEQMRRQPVPHQPRPSWRDDPPTEKQLARLAQLGYTGPDPITKGLASDLIDELKRRLGTE